MARSTARWQFTGGADAAAQLESMGWTRAGSGGLVRKYERFIGLPVEPSHRAALHELRLGAHGVAELRVQEELVQSPVDLPSFVVPSLRVLLFLNDLVSDCNRRLHRQQFGHVMVQWEGHNQFVVRTADQQRAQPVRAFPNPLAACDWAVHSGAFQPRGRPLVGRPTPQRWPPTPVVEPCRTRRTVAEPSAASAPTPG